MAKSAPVNLSDFKVKALRPDPAGEYVQGDTQVPGFGVRVRPTGAASYIVMKRLPGAERSTRVTVGKVGEISLAHAREKAREAIAAVRSGVDPNAEKERARARGRDVKAETGYRPDTFGATAEHYIRAECKALARGVEIEQIIRKRLLPPWGDRPLDELRRRDLSDLLDPIVEAGKVPMAHKLREVAIRIVNWAIDRGDLDVNYLASPSRGRRRSGVLRLISRDRVLTHDEIATLWAACDRAEPPIFGDFIKLALMLGQRREEIAAMERTELDLDAGLWVIPARRYKTKVEHAVPLPHPAVELIRALPVCDDRYVFSTLAGTRFSGFSKAKDRLDKLTGIPDWHIHDLRRTLRTGLSSVGVSADIAERVLGHVVGGVRGVYDRYSYLDEKRDALDRWAAKLQTIISPPPDNVVALDTSGGMRGRHS